MSDVFAVDVVDAREQDRNPRPEAIPMCQEKPIGRIVGGDQILDVDPGVALGQTLRGRRFRVGAAEGKAQGIQVLDEQAEARQILGKPDLESVLLAVGPGQPLMVGMEDEDVDMRVPRALLGGRRGGQRQASHSKQQSRQSLPSDGDQGEGARQRRGWAALPPLLPPTPPYHVAPGTCSYASYHRVCAVSGPKAILPAVHEKVAALAGRGR